MQQLQHPDFELVVLFVAIIVGVSNMFLYCFFGKLSTDSFMKMCQCLFESNWFKIQVDLQKYFILMIADAQKPLYYHGFHMAILNLETFAAVNTIKPTKSSNCSFGFYFQFLKTAITYFMVFKTLTT